MKAKDDTKEKFRLIIKEIEYDFDEQQSVKFVSYGERHVDNGCLRIILGEKDFLFDPEQVGELREFLESEK